MAAVAIGKRQLVKMAGAARTVLEQIKLFREYGCDVDVVTGAVDRGLFSNLGANFYEVSCWPLKGYWEKRLFSYKAEKKVRSGNYTLSIGHGDTLAPDIQFLHNCVHTAHEKIHGEFLPPGDPTGRFHAKFLTEAAFHLLVTNSGQMKKDVITRFHLPAEKIRVVYPGVDLGQFNTRTKSQKRTQKRQELGLKEDELVIGLITSGNFKKRNVDLFIRAVAGLTQESFKKCRFFVVGKDKSTPSYRSQAHAAGVAQRLEFIEPVEDVEALHHACDVAVLPAKWEEFGRVVLEAMACGLPVVVSDQVGSAELLKDQARDFIVPAGDEQALRKKLETLIHDKDLRNQLAQLNTQTAEQYTDHKQAQKFLHELQQSGFF